MKAGFVSNFSAGFLQMLAYIFVVSRAVAGALGVGSVVKYAGIIYRFSQAIAHVFLILDEYAVSSDRQSSTLEYLNMEDVLPKGTLPVEKRAFCEGGVMIMRSNSGTCPSGIPGRIPMPLSISI